MNYEEMWRDMRKSVSENIQSLISNLQLLIEKDDDIDECMVQIRSNKEILTLMGVIERVGDDAQREK
jgi:hypothetical protein